MNTVMKFRRLIINLAGILALVVMLLGGSRTVLAAPARAARSDISITL